MNLQTVQVPIPTGGLRLSSQGDKVSYSTHQVEGECHRLQIELESYHKPCFIPPKQTWQIMQLYRGQSTFPVCLPCISVVVNYLPNVIINLKVKLFKTMNYNS